MLTCSGHAEEYCKRKCRLNEQAGRLGRLVYANLVHRASRHSHAAILNAGMVVGTRLIHMASSDQIVAVTTILFLACEPALLWGLAHERRSHESERRSHESESTARVHRGQTSWAVFRFISRDFRHIEVETVARIYNSC